jgi:hypothetical protein
MRTERGKGNAGRKLVWGTLAGLFLAGLVSLALGIRTNEVELGRDSVYDGTVKIARNEGGALVFQDNELTSPVKLSALGGSATQHGTLTGLSADDHPQYLNSARHLSGHHAAYNAALPVPPDIHGNATLGAHVSDSDIHLNRTENIEITGGWRFYGGLLVNGQVTLPAMNSAGFVKNGADGLLSGGNTVHLDSPDVTGVLPASHVATDLTVSSSGLVDAGAVKSGTLSNDRFSAFSDLWSENKVGSSDEQVARGNHVHNQFPADYVDKLLETSQTMQGALVLPSLNVGEATNAGDGEIKIQHAQNAPRVTTVYMAPQNQTQGPHLVSEVFPSDYWYDRDNILHDDDADAATYTTGAWPRQHLYVYDAGFTNLDAVTFTGIEVTFRAKSDRAGDANALFVNCVHGSQKLGNAKEQIVGTSFATHTLGGSSDLWGMTEWEAQTYIPVNPSFGLELDSSLYDSGDKVWVDWIKIKIYYTQNSAARVWSAGCRTADGDYAIGQDGDLSTSLSMRLSRTTRLPQFPSMTTAGVLKNDASGNVTGGNYIHQLAASDGTPNPALSVDATGQVGIGTASPGRTLDVNGTIRGNSTLTFGSTPGVLSYVNTGSGNTLDPADDILSLYDGAASTKYLKIWYGGTNYLQFSGPNGADTNARSCLYVLHGSAYFSFGDTTGGFGIANTNPSEKLDVTGNIKFSGSLKQGSAVRIDTDGDATVSSVTLASAGLIKQGSTTRLDGSGNATLGNITSGSYNVPRGRGIGTTLPSTDLRDWDMFFRSDIETLYIYVSGSWRAAASLP